MLFNQQDPVTILAAKEFASGGGSATFAGSCEAGTLTVIKTDASPGSPAEFELSNFPWDGTLCDVTEPIPPAGSFEVASTCNDLSIVPSDDDTLCTITKAQTRATFQVTKVFADHNDVDEVTVSIDCNTGLILDQDKLLSDGESVEFVVTDYTEGSLSCTITEDGQAGYAGEYDKLSLGHIISAESCDYPAETIVGETAHECVITNTPLPVDVNVYKDWVFSANSAPDIDTFIRIEIGCDSEVIFDEESACSTLGPASGTPSFEQPSGGYYVAYCEGTTGLNDVGMSVQVVPNFPSTECTVTEYVFDQAIEVDNGCGTFEVSVGNGKECIITNTVFFEGIPTLSQYGMALLALLMLDVGFVSFRRFS